MDVKGIVKSKRSHTKHHQPRKPHRPNTQPTPSSLSSSRDPKVLKEEGERMKSKPGSSLPSNWDRYYESDDDEGLFGPDSEYAGGSAAKTDVVKPKTKGADFGFLISEAMSQSSASFSSTFDDMLPDFSQGLGSMLSVRGENILSWTGSDNFFMEDEEATSREVPFLSLNLQTLSEDLARIDLAQRLFIEEDILPPELRAPQKVKRESPMPILALVDDLAFQYSSKVEERAESKEECSLHSDSVETSNRTPLSFRQKGQFDDSIPAHESDSSRVLDPKESVRATQKAEIEKKPRFEAGAAETELDMLLDSFDETALFGSSNADINAPSAVIKRKTSATSNDSTHLNSSKSSLSDTNVDNDIDELLQETSVGVAISHPTEVNADSVGKQLLSSSPQPGTKSEVMEDFDSWLDTI